MCSSTTRKLPHGTPHRVLHGSPRHRRNSLPAHAASESGQGCPAIRERNECGSTQRCAADARTSYGALLAELAPRSGTNVPFGDTHAPLRERAAAQLRVPR